MTKNNWLSEIAKTKELHRELQNLRQELQKKLAEDAARQKEMSIPSGVTDDPSENDNNQVKKYQKVVKALTSRNKVVQHDEIKDIAYKLSIRLRVLRLEIPAILKVVLAHQYFRDQANIDHLNVLSIIEIIGRRPFDLKRPKEIALLARYLVEDNSEENASFSLNNWNTLEVVCSIFKHLLGSYETFKEEKNAEIKTRLKTVNASHAERAAQLGQGAGVLQSPHESARRRVQPS